MDVPFLRREQGTLARHQAGFEGGDLARLQPTQVEVRVGLPGGNLLQRPHLGVIHRQAKHTGATVFGVHAGRLAQRLQLFVEGA